MVMDHSAIKHLRLSLCFAHFWPFFTLLKISLELLDHIRLSNNTSKMMYGFNYPTAEVNKRFGA